MLNPPQYKDIRNYVGDPGAVPYDIQFRRNSNAEVMQRMGTPILLKHMWDIEDVESGVAQRSPSFDTVYEQTSYDDDQLSHGVGFVSVEIEPTEWYDPTTYNVISAQSQPQGYLPAPKYRGFGPGYLTYAILPDRPEDTWRLTEAGALIRQQTAMVQLPWYPAVGDNDLIIVVDLAANGRIINTYERYQLNMVAPITMRGSNPAGFRSDWSGYREADTYHKDMSGNRFWIGQQAELTKVPTNDNSIYGVEVDR